MKINRFFAAGAMMAAAIVPMTDARAQEVTDSARIAELERQVEAITRELERQSLGVTVVEADSSVLGFGPAASRVYRVSQGVSIGGYGEVLYENFADERENDTPSSATDRLDALRAIVYVGYKFNDRILFNSEIEFEHGSTSQAGSASVEFAYIDYRLSDAFGFRGGLLLSPMGFLNELHEPPIFLGTERPLTENAIIPTTWRENGIGAFGGNEAISWRVYLMNSLDGVGGGSSNAGGFSSGGLRGGRQKGSSALAEDLGVVGRIDYVGTLGMVVGGSVFRGGTAHGRALDGSEVDGTALIWEGHAEYNAWGWDLRALVAGAQVDDVEALNELRGLEGSGSIGESMLGWYVQAGYDLLAEFPSTHQFIPYARYEVVNTQREVPDGFSVNPANERTILSVGAAWKPVPQVVTKVDYQVHTNEAETATNQFNIALGYLF